MHSWNMRTGTMDLMVTTSAACIQPSGMMLPSVMPSAPFSQDYPAQRRRVSIACEAREFSPVSLLRAASFGVCSTEPSLSAAFHDASCKELLLYRRDCAARFPFLHCAQSRSRSAGCVEAGAALLRPYLPADG